MTLGGRLLAALEVWGAASLLVRAVHFVRPMNRAVYAVMAINAAVTLAICLFVGEAGWLQVSKEKSFFFFLFLVVCVADGECVLPVLVACVERGTGACGLVVVGKIAAVCETGRSGCGR